MVKSKWRNIRDQYQRELKRLQRLPNGEMEEYCGKWTYFERMSFLRRLLLPEIIKRVKRKCLPRTQPTGLPFKNTQDEIENMFDVNSTVASVSIDPLDSNDEANDSEINIVKTELSSDVDDCSNGSSVRQYEIGVKRTAEAEEMVTQTKKACTTLQELGSSFSGIDDDFCFMASLVPYLKKLTPIRKLIVRKEIQSLVIKELLCSKCRRRGLQKYCFCTKM